MGRRDRRLPSDFAGRLTFDELAQALDALVGEDVAVRIDIGSQGHGVVDMFGSLACDRGADERCVTLVVGDVAYIRLANAEIHRITMATMEASFYVRIAIELESASIAIADRELQGLAKSAHVPR